MRIIKKILYFILGVFALIVGVVLICAFRPDVTEAIAEFLYPNANQILAEAQNFSGNYKKRSSSMMRCLTGFPIIWGRK